MPVSLINTQIDAIMSEIGADAVKTGMLPGADVIRGVAERLEFYALAPAVIDPALVNRAGVRLFDDAAVDAVRSFLFPLAAVVTPNSRSDLLALTPERIETRNNHGSSAPCRRPSPPGCPGGCRSR